MAMLIKIRGNALTQHFVQQISIYNIFPTSNRAGCVITPPVIYFHQPPVLCSRGIVNNMLFGTQNMLLFFGYIVYIFNRGVMPPKPIS